ncbi:MAG: metal ABC transporter permease, partial [Phycisphaeraceae bacterium]|nr:metal ABC transporter permease [Phycisphaeraceae bacterium]
MTVRRWPWLSWAGLIAATLLLAAPVVVSAAVGHEHHGPDARPTSLADRGIELPDRDQLWRLVTLRDHNTRVVVFGTAMLGMASGLVGGFLLLRERALLGDAVSHATLPGIALAFMAGELMGGGGKSLVWLRLGAAVAGVIGGGCVLLIRNHTRLKEDAALAIVLSVFFGLGVALMGLVQDMQSGHAAGLESFIYGKTGSMLTRDAVIILGCGLFVVIACGLLFKELTLLTFDQAFAASEGVPVRWLDAGLMSMAVIITVIGLQAVGLILIIAMLIIPPAAARFWTHRLHWMLLVGAGIGGASGLIGAGLSALVPRLPAGAIIVVVASMLFGISLLIGPARGVLPRLWRQLSLNRRIARQHLLRAAWEIAERQGNGGDTVVTWEQLRRERSWTAGRLKRLLRRATAR